MAGGKTKGNQGLPAVAPNVSVINTTASQTPVADASNAGAPFIPGQSPPIGAAAAPAGPAADELIVEIELAPGTTGLGNALTSNTMAFMTGASAPSAPGSGLASICSKYGLREARPVFSNERVAADEGTTNALRRDAVVGAAAPDRVTARERLPSLSQFVRLRFPAGTPAADVTAALKRIPEVARAVAVPKAMPPSALAVSFPSSPVPEDPLIGSPTGPLTLDPATNLETQWYLHRTRVPKAWRYARGANVVIADVDWGYRTSHQELSGAIEKSYNAVDGSEDVTHGASAAHGTAVLGIAGARSNSVGMTGYAPAAALWAIQGDSGVGPRVFEEPWAEAIDFVRRTDAQGRRKIINFEVQTGLGGNYEQLPSVHRAIRAAIIDGCVVCVAAGNGNRAADRSDADEPFDPTGSILVGATAYHPTLNKRAWFSNFGSRVVVSAPGDTNHDLTCAQSADNAYRNGFGGTSGATPKVAGTVALMLSVNPDLTHADVRDILSATGLALTEDPGKSIGVMLNAEAAVAEALRRRAEVTPSDPLLRPVGAPPPEDSAQNPLHGVHRRRGQMVLPQDANAPLSWDDEPGAADLATDLAADAPGEKPPVAGDKPLRLFRSTVEGTLTQEDRILIVEQAIQMLDNFYVHRPLKEAMHAVRPIQRLRVLLRRLQPATRSRDGEDLFGPELSFHNALTQIFNSVRDLHTNYLLPRPFRDYFAFLPFEVAPFFEAGIRRYLVTRTAPGYVFEDSSFGPGAELIYWNGMSIERAVRSTADQTAGSNEAARHARGVSALTIRPMHTTLPPDADYVDLEFVARGADANDQSARRRMRQAWFARYATAIGGIEAGTGAASPVATTTPPPPPPPALSFGATSLDLARESTARASDLIFGDQAPAIPPAPAPPAASPTVQASGIPLAAVLGLDMTADAVREARQLLFEPTALRDLSRAKRGEEKHGIRGSASPATVDDATTAQEITVKVPWNAAFRARIVKIDGVDYGHIHIRTFYVPDADGFVSEFVRLLGQIPETGLILDVRGNGGGNIWAAERLLQTLTPREIEPERLQFVVTAGTLDLCRNNAGTSQIDLRPWLASLEEGVETGATYSHAFSITERDSCNTIGQRYYGPTVLVVDGNCYSATDMFAAGFQDHRIGRVLGVSNATGAGGANVWDHGLLHQSLPSGWGLRSLPGQASMRVAIRQCLRVGGKAGALLEDFGVVPDAVHPPTRQDVMEGDRDLLARAAAELRPQQARTIKVTTGEATADGRRQLTVQTRNLKRLDFFVDDRPLATKDLEPNGAGVATLADVRVRVGAVLRLAGYVEPQQRTAVAVYRAQVS